MFIEYSVDVDINTDDILEQVETKDLVRELESRGLFGHKQNRYKKINIREIIEMLTDYNCSPEILKLLQEWSESRTVTQKDLDKWMTMFSSS